METAGIDGQRGEVNDHHQEGNEDDEHADSAGLYVSAQRDSAPHESQQACRIGSLLDARVRGLGRPRESKTSRALHDLAGGVVRRRPRHPLRTGRRRRDELGEGIAGGQRQVDAPHETALIVAKQPCAVSGESPRCWRPAR